ncbi:BZIP family transcription factor [Rhexocercosporidium sp. MPI-PUGE-AT-0058]|nr:BZIP family transcription factor [Rhexocercosporidium sp. MPI-PUGE-AT-0058]
MTASNLSDNSSSDNFNPSDIFGDHHPQQAPSNTSPISSNSTPKSSKSTTKTRHSPVTSTPRSTHDPPSKIQKRTLNTLAARRYRQKRVDQVSSLETSLKETQDERDELKLKVARLEAEVEVLRGLLKK